MTFFECGNSSLSSPAFFRDEMCHFLPVMNVTKERNVIRSLT